MIMLTLSATILLLMCLCFIKNANKKYILWEQNKNCVKRLVITFDNSAECTEMILRDLVKKYPYADIYVQCGDEENLKLTMLMARKYTGIHVCN